MTMTQLSSAAQSVFNALGEQLYELNSQHIAAAVTALRAAADEMGYACVNESATWLNEIAAELEGQ